MYNPRAYKRQFTVYYYVKKCTNEIRLKQLSGIAKKKILFQFDEEVKAVVTCLKKGANFVVYAIISLSSDWLISMNTCFIIMFFLSGKNNGA